MSLPYFDSQGFESLSNGLLVPGSYTSLLKSAQEEKEEARRGTYFSDWGTEWAGIAAGPSEKPAGTVSFNTLRKKLLQSQIDLVIFSTRKSQVKHLAKRCIIPNKQVGYRVVHERYADPNFDVTDDIKERCREVEHFIDHPAKGIHSSFAHLATIAVHEEMCIDRKVMIKTLGRGQRPVTYQLIPGDTIKPVVEVVIPWMKKKGWTNVAVATEAMSEKLGIDLTKADYLQVLDEKIVGAWDEQEIDVDITQPSIEINQILYGTSLLEVSLEATEAFLAAWNYNTELFKLNMPESVLVVQGNYDQRGLEQFRRKILQSTGPAGNWRLPIIPGSKEFDIKSVQVRQSPREMMFDEFLRFVISIKCAAYRMHPSEINFGTDSGQSTVLNAGSEETQIKTAQEEGLHSILENLAEWFTRSLVKPFYDDLVFIWEGLERHTEAERISMNVQKMQYQSPNEIRATEDLVPMSIPDDLSKMDPNEIPQSAITVQLLQLKLEWEQMKNQQKQMEQATQMQQQAMQQAQQGQQATDPAQQAQAQQQEAQAQPQQQEQAPQEQEGQGDFWGRANTQAPPS